MNIKITYNWLLEYLDTDATPQDLQKYLSLCGPSIERIHKVGDDYVLDIEVTSNRVDMASVFGIAQEAQAILPLFGKKARIKYNPLEQNTFNSINTPTETLPLTLELKDPALASRISTVVLSNIKIQPSPKIISSRLEMCDIKSINNVVDISNYLMLSLGQPTHIFDYDGIKGHTMIVRESRKGEKITTLDGKSFILPGGDIAIEDASGELIDLAGIMGGLHSSITKKTKNVVLFIETFDKKRIRKTSMVTGQRTIAATYFEKGLDEERVEPTLSYGVELLEKYAGGQPSSKIYDIYPNPYKKRIILVNQGDITKIMGINLPAETVKNILTNLGFSVVIARSEATKQSSSNEVRYQVTIPSWRNNDIEIKEDVVEEVARVYGYHNLPNAIQPTVYIKQPKDIELLFTLQSKIKHFLKHLGIHETMNYSMVSADLLKQLDLDPKKHLEIANTISEEIRYFRQSLIPSLVKNMKDNSGKRDELKFFEIAKVYLPKKNDLPTEEYRLTLATNSSFYDLKGIVEALFRELTIANYSFTHESGNLLDPQARISIAGHPTGVMGQLKATLQDNNELSGPVFIAELKFQELINHYKLVTTYKPPHQYAVVKLDLTIEVMGQTFETIKQMAYKTSPLLKNIEFVNQYENKTSLRLYFAHNDRNITEDDAKKELESIKKSIIIDKHL